MLTSKSVKDTRLSPDAPIVGRTVARYGEESAISTYVSGAYGKQPVKKSMTKKRASYYGAWGGHVCK